MSYDLYLILMIYSIIIYMFGYMGGSKDSKRDGGL